MFQSSIHTKIFKNTECFPQKHIDSKTLSKVETQTHRLISIVVNGTKWSLFKTLTSHVSRDMPNQVLLFMADGDMLVHLLLANIISCLELNLAIFYLLMEKIISL